jgi:PIN domain nuclease of toxin-antitoxin system
VRPLLDSHAVLWWMADDPQLSRPAREAIETADEPLVSAATLIELSVKVSLGKLQVPAEWSEELLAEGFALLHVSPAHGHALAELPFVEVNGRMQRDPFDRLLVAQADVESIPLVTCDPGLKAHGVATIW